jgi:hypothetical protein
MALIGINRPPVNHIMQNILLMNLPNDKVTACWVGLKDGNSVEFIAVANTRDNTWEAKGDTISDALLELSATILITYPLPDTMAPADMNINIPISVLVKTKTFQKFYGDIMGYTGEPRLI